ncbi:putative transcription factor interactor and regulator CCHC(Zn) family [Helianthus annuus]|nr:putative transcription factor interactor and regulator CCHC(Zn) family [Helianthus annuus]
MLVQYDWWLDPGQSRLQAVVLRRWDFGGCDTVGRGGQGEFGNRNNNRGGNGNRPQGNNGGNGNRGNNVNQAGNANRNNNNQAENGGGNEHRPGYFNCGDIGHYKRNCPELNQARGRVFNIEAREARQDPNVVTGTFPVNQRFTSVLFDTGADYSFASLEFKNMLGLAASKLDIPYSIELANGKLVGANEVVRGCVIELGEREFNLDLLPVQLGSITMRRIVVAGIARITYASSSLRGGVLRDGSRDDLLKLCLIGRHLRLTSRWHLLKDVFTLVRS